VGPETLGYCHSGQGRCHYSRGGDSAAKAASAGSRGRREKGGGETGAEEATEGAVNHPLMIRAQEHGPCRWGREGG